VSAASEVRRSPRVLIFRLGGRAFAAASAPGGRIVEIDAWTRVPTGPRHLLGLANAQGRALALIDVRPTLGLSSSASWARPLRAIVVGASSLRVAFAIEEILGFEPVDPERLPVAGARATGEPSGFGLGVLDIPPWLPTLIDVAAVVEALRVGHARLPPTAAPAPELESASNSLRPPTGGPYYPIQPQEEGRWKLH
jgi:purine-binding chemotaxis protein CheW